MIEVKTKDLFLEIEEDNKRKVLELLEQGANVNIRNEKEDTLLICDVNNNNADMSKLLIEKGAKC